MKPTETPAVAKAPDSPPAGIAPQAQLSFSVRAAQLVTRLLAMCAGLGLLVGFFLPWLKLGELSSISGFALLVSSGTVVDELAGPSHSLLFIIPTSGLVLAACSVIGPRAAARAALSTGLVILTFGFYAVASAFINTTGIGMWLVVLSALVAAGVGLAATGSARR